MTHLIRRPRAISQAIACVLWLPACAGSGSSDDARDSGAASDAGQPDAGPDAALDASVPYVLPVHDGGAPNASGRCTAGAYAGRFMCTYKGKPGDIFSPPTDIPVEGDVHIEVVEEMQGTEFVSVGTGELVGNANGLYDFRTEVMGTLDCVKGTFMGAVTGGSVSFFGIPIGDFGGPLTADYDGMHPRFQNGEWALTFGPTGGVCAGTWNADLTLADGGLDAGASDAAAADSGVTDAGARDAGDGSAGP